ncbi:hypothetical protein MtrunA17_Chr8g0382111 [Medicago truncatula]|nr:uncharacterized protein LOC25501903 [Medicago truncatula]XP_039684507.1 uncharacterized protein LOC25501903 [Medicago truncatula]RHN42911.1 hypothetical protein MtrunA17_Chr8g0382111 [Medicago truncatula]
MESDINSDSEDGDFVRNLNEANDLNVDSLHLSDKDEGHESHRKEESFEAGENSGSEKEEANNTEENNDNAVGIEAELTNSLSKQRKSAIASARKGRKKLASWNSHKDKGGRSSHNSKAQMQMSSW